MFQGCFPCRKALEKSLKKNSGISSTMNIIEEKLGDCAVKFYDSQFARKLFTNTWYTLATKLDSRGDAIFLNYGYAYLDSSKIDLKPEDEPDRYSIQLYHQLALHAPIAGAEVLEVGCGKGGGASYVTRYLRPKKYIGVDKCDAEIKFAKRRFSEIKNLSFKTADAHMLPFVDNTFDAVLNVETSHHYANMPMFLGEVRRVLKPGGTFLMTCYRKADKVSKLKEELAHSGLEKMSEEEINENVVRALDLEIGRAHV
jgi:SAM-dependent methyltransferase